MKLIPVGKRGFTKVNSEDYHWVNEFRWQIQSRRNHIGRIVTKNKKRKMVWLHRAIMNCPKGMEIDHINGDALDNQRENLRICTRKQNGMHKVNTQRRYGYKGVYKTRGAGFVALICVDKHTRYLGYYRSAEEAARAYDVVAEESFGGFASLNFPYPQ